MKAAFLIHGFASDKDDFGHLAPLLGARYSVVHSPNLPYHGKGNEKSKLSSDDIINFVLEQYDLLAQKYDKIDVFGFSMGGALAAFLAAQRPVNRLVLLAPASRYFSAEYWFASAKYFLDTLGLNSKKRLKEDMASNPADVRKDNAAASKMFFKTLLPRYTLKNLSEFTKVIKKCNSKLKPISAPVLVIWGRLDQLVPFSSIKFLRTICTNVKSREIIYGDMSHYMLYSRAFYKITDDIFRFLEETDAPLLTYSAKPKEYSAECSAECSSECFTKYSTKK